MRRSVNRERINQGVLLVLAGLYFLLRNLGLIDASFWNTLIDHWPILLIFAGIYVMFSRSIFWFIPAGLAVLLFLMFAGFVPGFIATDLPVQTAAFNYSVEDQPNMVDIILDSPVAEVYLTKGTLPSVSGDVQYRRSAPTTRGRQVGDRFVVDFTHVPETRSRITERMYAPIWDIALPPTLPTSVTVRSAVSDLLLDVGGLDIREVDVQVSVGKLEINFDESVREAQVSIDAAVSSVGIFIPKGIGVRAKVDGALLWNNLNRHGFKREGNVYFSPEYHEASRRVNIELNAAVGTFTLNRDASIEVPSPEQ